jgi:hypothetical protein
MKGFPPNMKLQDLFMAHVFTAILHAGMVTDSNFTADNDKQALM